MESAYEQCLAYELTTKHIPCELQKVMPVVYKSVKIDCGYRIDILVANKLIVELKAVAAIEPINEAQLLTYLKLAKAKTGLLINFNVPQLKQGLKRFGKSVV